MLRFQPKIVDRHAQENVALLIYFLIDAVDQSLVFFSEYTVLKSGPTLTLTKFGIIGEQISKTNDEMHVHEFLRGFGICRR